MWGDPTSDCYEILLNDRAIKVRKNLHDFLQLARCRYPNLSLWIDALCINQNDDIEKSRQVHRMADIYRGASETLIWLSDHPSVSKHHMELALDCIKSCTVEHPHDAPKVLDTDTFEGLKVLARHPYWDRIWITQEILLSGSLKILFADCEVGWGSFGTARSSWFALQHIGTIPNKPSGAFGHCSLERLLSDWAVRHSIISHGVTDAEGLWHIMKWRESSGCSDSRDRIYGMLSLLKGDVAVQKEPKFRVDYSEPTIDLFWRAADYFDAWSSLSRITRLQKALELDLSQLLASLHNNPDRQGMVTIARVIEHIHEESSTYFICFGLGWEEDCLLHGDPKETHIHAAISTIRGSLQATLNFPCCGSVSQSITGVTDISEEDGAIRESSDLDDVVRSLRGQRPGAAHAKLWFRISYMVEHMRIHHPWNQTWHHAWHEDWSAVPRSHHEDALPEPTGGWFAKRLPY